MLHFEILAIGKLKNGPLHALAESYREKIAWPLVIHEIESRYTDPRTVQADEERRILDRLAPHAFIVVLDERGHGLRSLDFAKTIGRLENEGEDHIQFILGGAEGLTEPVRARASLLLSFGQQTWPHMLARVMLLEQLYRARQILAGHPYHRE